MAYYFYLDKMLLPVAPSKVNLKINNQNKTMNLINEGEINILKQPKLTDIDFDVLIPQIRYPFALYKDGFKGAKYYLDWLEELKTGMQPFELNITRELPNGDYLFGNSMKVSLEDYKVKEDKREGFDLIISISLKQYRDYGTKIANVSSSNSNLQITNNRSTESSPAPKRTAKTHTVSSGDTLWVIAKKYYGDGSQYIKIYNANKDKIKNANLIYPNQVLTIPV